VTAPAAIASDSSRERVAARFGALGYPVDLVEIDPRVWQEAGFPLCLPPNVTLFHAARVGAMDLIFLDSPEEVVRDVVEQIFKLCKSYNHLLTYIIVTINRSTHIFSIFDQSSTGRLRRLDCEVEQTKAETARLLGALRLTAGHVPAPAEWQRMRDAALGRNSVTRSFLRQFRRGIALLSDEISVTAESEQAVASQALLILSRLLFLHFIQKKGWLNGERDFLGVRLASTTRSVGSIYRRLVAPLFFGCLNTPVPQRKEAARALGRIPYLNGGLFEQSSFEERHPKLSISNATLESLFEMFAAFTFSLDESDEEGVHIDPEMLGKVFESLMAEDERAASGSFYTPKKIVDVLTRAAIIRWCAAGDRETAMTLGRVCDKDSSGLDRARSLPLLDRLARITIVDPACGSGAFLLSSLQLVEALTIKLSEAAGQPVPPNLRQRIVERSLYGVDIKPEAVRLCELRLWLAVVTSSRASLEEVVPLPNLDRNIIQGNALLSPLDFLGNGRREIYRDWAVALRSRRAMVEEFRHALPERKPSLRRLLRRSDEELAVALLQKSIERDEREIEEQSVSHPGLFDDVPRTSRWPCTAGRLNETRAYLARVRAGELGFFSFDVQFSAPLAEGGFSVVVGNPPWVRSSRIESGERRMFSERYESFGRSPGARHGFVQSDLAVAFFEKGQSLLGPGGVLALLVPSKFATAEYAARLRSRCRSELTELHDWSEDGREHFDADTFPLGIVLQRGVQPDEPVKLVTGKELISIGRKQFEGARAGAPWRLVSPPVGAVLERIGRRFPPLRESLGRAPLMGVKTGANHRFFLPDLVLERGEGIVEGTAIRIPAAHLCRAVRGRDVRRFRACASSWMLWPPLRGWHQPPDWLCRLAVAWGLTPEDFRLSFVKPEHLGTKVVWKDVSRGLQAAVLPEQVEIGGRPYPLIPNQTTYFLESVSLDEARVQCALLNSTIVGALALSVADRAKDRHYRYFGSLVAGIPYPTVEPSSREWLSLVRLVRKAEQGAGVMEELDEVVRLHYEVSRQELAVLSEFVSRRLRGNRDAPE